jgi:hypothetical protein
MLALRFSSPLLALALLGGLSTAQQQDPADPIGAIGVPETGLGVNCVRVPLCPNAALINGEAYAGNNRLWQTDFNADVIKLVDVSNNCTVLQTCPAPGGLSPSENTLLGSTLYHYDFGTGLMYGINTANCAVVSTCNPPGDDFAEGLTNDGTFLWRGDSTTLYKFDPANCQVVATCPNPPGDSADGLSMCGQFLLMLGYSGRVYQIDPTTCRVVSSCILNQGAAGNGIASDRISRLFADQPTNIDQLDLDCDVQFGFPNFLDPTPCGVANTVMGSAGVPLSFQVIAEANTDLPGEFVTLTSGPLPAGASMTPNLPVQGQPASSTFNWTPGVGQVGVTTVLFIATDQLGQSTTCEVTINIAECHLVLGFGGGSTSMSIFGHLYDTQLNAIRSTYPVTMIDYPDFRVPHPHSNNGGPAFHTRALSVQVLMYNPEQFPDNPSQWSRRMQVDVDATGKVTGSYYGTRNGIDVFVDTFTDANGTRRMKFPFTIDGM